MFFKGKFLVAGLVVGAAFSPLAAASTQFSLCHRGGGVNCVVDGDTIWYRHEKIRVADIDTPETHPARCADEARLGRAATLRLQQLLNQGPFTLQPIRRDTDRYGRKLRILMRNGVSLGEILVREGLARRYSGGRRQPWCA
ncbi:MAG: thermonuclease family protein [Chakrabartia sp.]